MKRGRGSGWGGKSDGAIGTDDDSERRVGLGGLTILSLISEREHRCWSGRSNQETRTFSPSHLLMPLLLLDLDVKTKQ